MKRNHLAGCVILNEEGKLLLIHRNTRKRVQWEIPGGKMEEKEKPQTTAKREAKEELNVEVEIVKKLGRHEFSEDDFIGDYTWYLALIKSGTLKLMEYKFDDMRYFSWEELNIMYDQLSANTKNLVKACFEKK